MIFSIQVSNPTYSTITNNDYDSIGDLLEDIFPLNTEQCIMFWNHVCIPLSYKYDISIILDDIIFIINEVSNNTNGYLEIDWPSNTFSAKWYISWDSVDLKINTKWYNIVGNIESILNNVNELAIKKIAF
ncbi:hypothetical protein DKL61_05930 [Gammaproteobacteria bacterium ESL0073]|nr:hypothetical protein DKL61_05930 [Gammaproteobacteria bacterium ESL0073]